MSETDPSKPLPIAMIADILRRGLLSLLSEEQLEKHKIILNRPIYDDDRGNVVLYNEARTKLSAWVRPFYKDNIWLEVEWVMDNYPSFHVAVIMQPDHQLAKHINKELTGWHVGNCGIDGVNIKDGEIVEPEELGVDARCPECGAKMKTRAVAPVVSVQTGINEIWYCEECEDTDG